MGKAMMREVNPIPMHMRCSVNDNGATVTADPPNCTMNNCIPLVKRRMARKSQLLKKPSKTLKSLSPNFLELISLNT